MPNFDLVRKSKSKDEVDIDQGTLESWGVTFYQMGKCMFFSKSELETLIRTKGKKIENPTQPKEPSK